MYITKIMCVCTQETRRAHTILHTVTLHIGWVCKIESNICTYSKYVYKSAKMAVSTAAVMSTQTQAPVLGAEDGNGSVRFSVGLTIPICMAASRDAATVSVVERLTNCVPFEVGFLDHMLTRVVMMVPFCCRREWAMFPANLSTEIRL